MSAIGFCHPTFGWREARFWQPCNPYYTTFAYTRLGRIYGHAVVQAHMSMV